MSAGALVIICLIFVVALVWFMLRQKGKIKVEVERTEIVSTQPVATGNELPFYMTTTFMVHMTDGSRKPVTVKNGTMEYKWYMEKLR